MDNRLWRDGADDDARAGPASWTSHGASVLRMMGRAGGPRLKMVPALGRTVGGHGTRTSPITTAWKTLHGWLVDGESGALKDIITDTHLPFLNSIREKILRKIQLHSFGTILLFHIAL